MTTDVRTLAALAKLDADCDPGQLLRGLAVEGVGPLFWALGFTYARRMDRQLGTHLGAPPNSSW
jgi:hypothetical protein